jgi:hypothetical protein
MMWMMVAMITTQHCGTIQYDQVSIEIMISYSILHDRGRYIFLTNIVIDIAEVAGTESKKCKGNDEMYGHQNHGPCQWPSLISRHFEESMFSKTSENETFEVKSR